ncbi:MAG: sarcosine oxidase subunit gamma family protein [Actinomycetota bacterium]
MDESLLNSPLAEWASRFEAAAPAVLLAEIPFTAIVNIRVRNRVAPDGAWSLIRLAPDEFLLTSRSMTAGRLIETLGDSVDAAVDVSAQYTTISLAGAESRDLLAGGCAVDLAPEVAPTGTTVHAPLAQANVVITVVDADTGSFELIVRASFADYLATWLTSAAREYGERAG